MNNKWIKFAILNCNLIKDYRDWCSLNCQHKFKIKIPKGYNKVKAVFQSEEDAAAFKLRWL